MKYLFQYLFNIYSISIQYLLDIYSISIQYLFKIYYINIYSRSIQDLLNICPKSIQDLFNTYSIVYLISGGWSKFLHPQTAILRVLLSRTPCLSSAGPMLGNNTSYEDSFTTCQSTQENHRSLLDSLFNMQLASRNPFSGQIVAD